MKDQRLKSLFVVNPDSQPAKIRHYLRDAARTLRRHSFLINPFFPGAPGEAEIYVRRCCDQSIDAVIVAEGDRTINQPSDQWNRRRRYSDRTSITQDRSWID
ncbi:MAG TPA: hypothetical protein ENN03_11930 [bacterium]|nr:hypothetical protein [bacterium]